MAQGALEIVVFPERVSVTARVSMEEVLVAAAYGVRKDLRPSRWCMHTAIILLAHLRVTADGRPLDGLPGQSSRKADGRPSYELEYRLVNGAPVRVALEQDVLREFEFAPGNPWEASYVVRVRQDGGSAVGGLVADFQAAARSRLEPR